MRGSNGRHSIGSEQSIGESAAAEEQQQAASKQHKERHQQAAAAAAAAAEGGSRISSSKNSGGGSSAAAAARAAAQAAATGQVCRCGGNGAAQSSAGLGDGWACAARCAGAAGSMRGRAVRGRRPKPSGSLLLERPAAVGRTGMRHANCFVPGYRSTLRLPHSSITANRLARPV